MNLQVLLCLCLLLSIATFSNGNKNVGGEVTTIKEFPHQIAFVLTNIDQVICGGSLLSSWYILSSAYCFYKKDLYFKYIKAFVATTNLKSRPGSGYGIEQFNIHPQYKGRTTDKPISYDITVAKVAVAIILNPRMNRIKLPTLDVSPEQDITISGWGIIPDSIAPASDVLRKTSTKILKTGDCNKHLKFPIKNDQFCTFTEVEKGACIGDSGGPVSKNDVLVGVIADNSQCSQGVPNVHTNVFFHLNFIQPIINTRNLS